MADDEMYLENLKEFVIDEERIVTYKWLSRTLSVNVNQAKQMLYAFIQQQQKEKSDGLCIIYIVGGSIKDKNGDLIQKYSLSFEEDLKDMKSCYENITSLHVYSVQKTKPKDSNILYLADYDLQKQNLDLPNRWSNIILKSITKRNRELPEETVESGNEEKRKPISNGCQTAVRNKMQVQSTSGPSTSAKNSKKSKPLMKKSDVASFFARQAANKNKETVKTVKAESAKEGKKAEKSGVKEEQNKCDDTPINENEKKEEKENAKDVEMKDVEKKENKDKLKTDIAEQADEDFDAKRSSPKQGKTKSRKTLKQNQNEKENQEEKETKSSSKKRKTSSKEENEARSHFVGLKSEGKTKRQRKKRKRVKNFSDTSSEEEDNSVNTKQSSSDATSIPDQQAQDNKPEMQKNRRRKRVLKSKTYLNDEGYMVTEKVYESESASSEDEQKQAATEVIANKPVFKDSIQPPKKKAANKATKQASLTSFFKRT